MTLHFASASPKLYITDYIQFAKPLLCKNKFCSTGIAGNEVVGLYKKGNKKAHCVGANAPVKWVLEFLV